MLDMIRNVTPGRGGGAMGDSMGREELPVHFLTIVLNGEPFIRYHADVFDSLPFDWHWHIIEGVAEHKHDTAWSLEFGASISDEMHDHGLSNDGTSQYLDELVAKYPDKVTVYRTPGGAFWDGKLEMVNAPIPDIAEQCLLWQVDADELWTADQLRRGRQMFIDNPQATAALYLCTYFVGEDLVITSIDTYGNNRSYEWLRTWRFVPGSRWMSHEPPRLCCPAPDGSWVDIAAIQPMMHLETARAGLVFQHFAYVTPEQLRFKELYYGNKNAVAKWEELQKTQEFPVKLGDYFEWVKDEAEVDKVETIGVAPLASRDENGIWLFAGVGA